MKPEFNRIYRNLEKHYRLENSSPGPEEVFKGIGPRPIPAREPTSLEMVAAALDSAVSQLDLQNKVREDGRYFLLVNFHQMVAMPLFHPIAPSIDKQQLYSALIDDLKLVLDEASRDVVVQDEVSGHRILDALARLWESLKVTRWDFWG